MAKSTNNVVTHGLKGKIGDLLIFKKQNGQTVVTKIPDRSKVVSTAAQTEVKERFKIAVKYAKNAANDPVLSAKYAAYQKNGLTVYNIALADYMVAPTLSLPQGTYNGELNTLLKVRAIDKYEVSKVSLKISDADGNLIEKGDASITFNGLDWEYSTSSKFATPIGFKLEWTAYDLAGNETLLEITS